ncbi:MAG TPA: ankyrin repeat domain-containing protein [Pirellulales bacterium]|jgi:ankyrin repeat protein|nr:ankyrin repeat domain-containing protein [Pirellulales bacterium]
MMHSQRYPLNAAGDFYVENGMCIACAAPEHEASDGCDHLTKKGAPPNRGGRMRGQDMADASKNRTDPRFYAIRDAAYSDRGTAAKLLAQDPTLIDVRNSVGETALHYLVVENDLPSVEWLLERGADVNTCNDFGSTPLLEAAGLGYLELCEFLVKRGADMETRNKIDETAMSWAADRGQQSVLTMLLNRLQAEADINAYFDGVSAEMTLKRGGAIADILTARGLKGYWQRQE